MSVLNPPIVIYICLSPVPTHFTVQRPISFGVGLRIKRNCSKMKINALSYVHRIKGVFETWKVQWSSSKWIDRSKKLELFSVNPILFLAGRKRYQIQKMRSNHSSLKYLLTRDLVVSFQRFPTQPRRMIVQVQYKVCNSSCAQLTPFRSNECSGHL